jgi:hypothetical protein
LRLAFLTTALLLLLAMPWGEASVILVLFVAADLGAAALLLRPGPASAPVIALRGDIDALALLRRTVPELRSRRPVLAIDAQIAWRQTAEAHRRRRELSFRLARP